MSQMIPNVRRVLIALVTFSLLAVTMAAPVLGAKGGNSPNAKLCQKGGWEHLVRQGDTTPFASEEECVAYGAMGGVLTRVFAVAFTDVNSNNSYESGADVLIAKLTDTNLDGVISVGDTITTDQYPLTTAAATFGNFGTTNHQVQFVHTPSATTVAVRSGNFDGNVFTWSLPGQVEAYSENSTLVLNGSSQIVDALGPFCDQVLTVLISPSAPGSAENHADCSGASTNNDFIDVIIDLSGI